MTRIQKKFPIRFAGPVLAGGMFAFAPLAAADPVLSPEAYIHLYPSQHMCASVSTQLNKPLVCGAMNNVLTVPADTSGARPVLIPHRGLWGGVGSEGVAENSIGAMEAASHDGYRIVEIDVMFSARRLDTGDAYPRADQITASHYFDMYAYGGTAGENPKDIGDLSSYKMRKRDMTRSAQNVDRLASIEQVISHAVSNNLVLTIDPKLDETFMSQPVGTAPEGQEKYYEYAAIIAGVLHEAMRQGALGHVVIKSNVGVGDMIPLMVEQSLLPGGIDHYFNHFHGKFLWSPIINDSRTKRLSDGSRVDRTPSDVAGVMDAWYDAAYADDGSNRSLLDPKAVFGVETQVFNSLHWTGSGFSLEGDAYVNILDYVLQYTEGKGAQRRPIMWSVDPAGVFGTWSRKYFWKLLGNGVSETTASNDDLRSDPTFLISRDHALRSAIITDRPNVYESMLAD